ncbi:MAG: hypothetical protein ACI9K3_001484, partial [Halovenus sp.]
WAVRPDGSDSDYPAEEAYFLFHVLRFVERSLVDDPQLDEERVREWVTDRRKRVGEADLHYVAHNLDVFGRVDTR